MRGSERDLAGSYFNGAIQKNTIYPDLTTLSQESYGACVADFFRHLQRDCNKEEPVAVDALAQAGQRFGPVIADTVCRPILQKLAGPAAVEAMSPLAMRLFPMDRVALFRPELAAECLGSQLLRSRIAFVDQRNLPLELSSNRASLYPRSGGIGQIIRSLESRLAGRNVSIQTGIKIEALQTAPSGGVRIDRADGTSIEADRVYWTAGLLQLGPLLGVSPDFSSMTAPSTTVLCHFLLTERTTLDDLHYLQCADVSLQTYRVTNYPAFCPSAADDLQTRVTVELIVDDVRERESAFWSQAALSELRMMGIVSAEAQAEFTAVEILPYGFPRCTLGNERQFDRVRSGVGDVAGGNIVSLGIGAETGMFFLADVLRHAYESVHAI